ncbi:1723_t:CDS:2, partial [Dentiscutata heterogama]
SPANTPVGFQPSVTSSESAIEKLTEAVNKMLTQFQERRPSTSNNPNRIGILVEIVVPPTAPNPPPNTPQNYLPTGQMYNPGPVPTPVVYPYPNIGPQNPPRFASSNVAPTNNNSNISPGLNSASETQQQEALQTLLAMAASLTPNQQNNIENQNPPNSQPTFLNIPVEDVAIFAVGTQEDKSSISTTRRYKRPREEVDNPLKASPTKPKRVPVVRRKSSTSPITVGINYFDKRATQFIGDPNINLPTVNPAPKILPLLSLKTKDDSFPTHHNRLISPFLSAPNGNPPLIFLGSDSDESRDSSFEWYETAWESKGPEYKFNIYDSDIDDVIDEIRRQLRVRKEKNKPSIVRCRYDLAGNAYLRGKEDRRDVRSFISTGEAKEERERPIRDLFEYYFGEESEKRNTYHLGNLDSNQNARFQSFLNRKTGLFTWEGGKLGCTNLVRHRINTGDALPIKKHPYWYSPAERRIIKDEIAVMMKEGIIYPL